MNNLEKYLNGESVPEGAVETIVFDSNSEPTADKIWAPGDGRLMAKSNGKWNDVDVVGGTYLQERLNAIVDLIPDGPSPIAPEPAIVIKSTSRFSGKTATEAAELLGISVDELIDLPNQMVIGVANGSDNVLLSRVYYLYRTAEQYCVFGVIQEEVAGGTGASVNLAKIDGLYEYSYYEV